MKKWLPDHSVFTVTDMKWNGLRNGQLMTKAVEQKFDVLITIDKNLLSQQGIAKYELIVVVLDAASSKIEDLQNFIPAFEKQLPSFSKKNGYVVNK